MKGYCEERVIKTAMEQLAKDKRRVLSPKFKVIINLARLQDSFECERCGYCCSIPHVPITLGEAKQAAAYLSISLKEFRKKYLAKRDKNMWVLKKRADGKCIFYGTAADGLPGCTIHPARSWTCIAFPFLHKDNIDRSTPEHLDMNCVCPAVAKTWERMRKQWEKETGRKIETTKEESNGNSTSKATDENQRCKG